MPKEDTQFKPGQSGNPAGKKPGTKSFTTKVKEALEKIAEGQNYTYEEAFIKSIMKKAIVDGDASTQRLIWNYLDGMPMQKMQHSGEIQIPIYGAKSLPNNDSDNKDIQPEQENQGSIGGDIQQ